MVKSCQLYLKNWFTVWGDLYCYMLFVLLYAIGPTYPKMFIVMVCTIQTYYTQKLWYVLHLNSLSYKICVHRQLWFVCFGPACLVSYSYCKQQVCVASMHKQLWYVWMGLAFYVTYKIIGLIIGIIHLQGLVISKSWYTGTL